MKQRVFLFSLLLALFTAFSPVTSSAQQPGSQSGIINWLNNGDFDAFLYSDIDSITYSKVDLNGQVHPNVVVQEIWTADSVYRTPINAIDSVAFKSPETIYKDGVFHITEWHYNYVTDATDMTVTFDASIPTDSLPCIGQVVVSDMAFVQYFEKGFAGRVVQIDKEGSTVRIVCEEISFEDIYDQLFSFGKSVSYYSDNTPSKAPQRLKIDEEDVIPFDLSEVWPIEPFKIIDDESGYVQLNVKPSISLNYAICYNVRGKEDRFKCVLSPTLDCSFDMNWSKSGTKTFEPKKPFVSVDIPTKIPLLFAQFNVSGFLDLTGSVDLSAQLPFKFQSNIGYDTQEGFVHNFTGSGIQMPQGSVDLSATVHAGLSLGFESFFINERLDWAEAGIQLKAGPQVTGTIRFETDNYDGLDLYDNFKNSKVTVEPIVAEMSAHVNTIFFPEEKTWSSEQWSVFGEKDYYLFPEFTAPHFVNSTSTAMTTDISKNLIFKVTPGIGLYQGNQLKSSYFSNSTYKTQDDWVGSNLQMALNNYPVGTYTAAPIFKIFNSTVKASPTAGVTVPEQVSLDKTEVYIKQGNTQYIQITGGWCAYSLSNNATSIVSATFVSKDGSFMNSNLTMWPPASVSGYENENPKIRIIAINNGSAVLKLKDLRTGRIVTVNVTVNNSGSTPAITVNPTSLNLGTIVKGGTSTKTFKVTGTDLTGNLTVSSNDTHFTVTPSSIPRYDAANGVDVTVTYKSTAAGTANGEITVSGGGAKEKSVSVSGNCVVPIITPSISSLDFGNVLVGSTPVKKTFTVTGTDLTGNLDLALSQTGAHGEFTISPTTITAAQAASGVTVTVTCSATDAGTFSGQITISGGGATTKKVSLSGTAVAPAISVDPSSLNFGTVVKGKTASKTFVVTGTNLAGDLTLSSNYTRFTVTPTTISKSEAANGVTVTVTYKPTAAANHKGQITVSGGGAESKTVTLKGTCIAPTITVDPSSLDFGTVIKGQTSSKTFIVTGTDLTGDLTLSSSNSRYTISPATISKADAANGVTVTVTYAPTAAGNHTGTITISGGDAASKTVSLSGTCVVPTITVNPTSLAFGDVPKGYPSSNTFTVTGKNLNGSMTVASSDSHFTVSPKTLPASGGIVTVTYNATATASGTITVSGGGAENKTVSVSATSVIPSLTANPNPVEIGEVLVGSSGSATFTVTGKNLPGDITMESNWIETYGGEFSITRTSHTTSGSTVTEKYKVTYTPSGAHNSGAQFTFRSGNETLRVAVNAKGVAPTPFITVNPTSLTFNNVNVGSSVTETFTVTGTNLTGNVHMIPKGSGASMYTVSPATITATEAAAGKKVTVTYSPTAKGTHSATVMVSSSGATSKEVTLTGTAIPGGITPY